MPNCCGSNATNKPFWVSNGYGLPLNDLLYVRDMLCGEIQNKDWKNNFGLYLCLCARVCVLCPSAKERESDKTHTHKEIKRERNERKTEKRETTREKERKN